MKWHIFGRTFSADDYVLFGPEEFLCSAIIRLIVVHELKSTDVNILRLPDKKNTKIWIYESSWFNVPAKPYVCNASKSVTRKWHILMTIFTKILHILFCEVTLVSKDRAIMHYYCFYLFFHSFFVSDRIWSLMFTICCIHKWYLSEVYLQPPTHMYASSF